MSLPIHYGHIRSLDINPTPPVTPDVRSEVYDPLWGYYLASMQVGFVYNEANVGRSKAVYTINGTFTINAEILPSGGTGTDESKYNSLKSAYEALYSALSTASEGVAPTAMSSWGTLEDNRCVPLPSGLLNNGGGRVYARPQSLTIEETLWPNLIKYSATLIEAEVPSKKVKISSNANDYILDGGVVTITAEIPRIAEQTYTFANGSELYFSGWNRRSFAVQGTAGPGAGCVSPPSGSLGNAALVDISNGFTDGKVDIKVVDSLDSGDELFLDLFIDGSSVGVSPGRNGKGTAVSFTAQY